MEEVKASPSFKLLLIPILLGPASRLYAQDGAVLVTSRWAIGLLAAGVAVLAVALYVVLRDRRRLEARASRRLEQKDREIVRAVRDMEESEKKYHRLFDDPAIGKILIDPIEEIVLDANPSVKALVGRPGEDLAGVALSKLDCDWMNRIINGPHPRGSQSRAIVVPFEHTEDGEIHYSEAWVSALHLAGQRAALLTTHDVTERRHLEEHRLRQEEREHYIAELEAKKAEVEARNAEMERFTYTVSHDLKSPLVTIRGFLGHLQKDLTEGNEKRVEEDFEHIDRAVVKMGRLLHDLLELSRIGRVTNPPETISITEVARQVTDSSLAAAIAEKGVVVEISPDIPYVHGDRQRFEEVIQNLVENAVKFMGGQESPRIEISWRRDGEKTIYFVRDNGMGIDERYHDRVFGLFDRLDPSVDGSGIGLALVKRIVEVHGGRIWVESKGLGQGSTFCFSL